MIHHFATTSLGLQRVVELASEYRADFRKWHEDSDGLITDKDWEAATKTLLAIEEELDIGRKLMQEFFRTVTDSTVDFYP